MKKLIESIANRYSPFTFSGKPIADEDLKTLFEAARWAPSSYNEQPWRFIYAKKEEKELWDKFLDILVPFNREWADTAAVFMLTVAKKTSIVTGQPNPYSIHDTGMAMSNMLNQATSMGIYAHQMGGYDKEKARKLLQIPDEYAPVAMVAMGYPGDISVLPEHQQERAKAERIRNPHEHFVFRGKWEQH